MASDVIRCFLAVCFILSGTLKVLSIRAFEQEVLMYCETYIGRWVSGYSIEIAIVVCALEIILGIAALLRNFAFLTGISFSLMLLVFMYLTGINLFFPSVMGQLETCGCFGEFVHFTPVSAFVKSVVLGCLALLNLYFLVKARKRRTYIHQ